MMKTHAGRSLNSSRTLFLAVVGVAALAVLVVDGLMAQRLSPQSSAQALASQSPAASEDRPTFDAASVKVNQSGGLQRRASWRPGGYFTATNFSLRHLVEIAYGLAPSQARLISGGPQWVDSEGFDIEARAISNPTTPQAQQSLLQVLLAERFKLEVHRQARQMPVYALVLSRTDRTGPQLHPYSEETRCLDPMSVPQPTGGSTVPFCGLIRLSITSGTVRITGTRVPIDELAVELGGYVDRQVLNRTGLNGVFDFDLSSSTMPLDMPPSQSAQTSAFPEIFTALQEQLGLKLEAQTGPVDVLVIDHVESPSPN